MIYSKSDEGEETYTWLNTTRCDSLIEKYGTSDLIDHINSDALGRFLEEEFATTEFGDGWLCPDVTSFRLRGDPTQFANGQQITAVVNRCDVAVKKDQESGLVPTYTNTTCAMDLTSTDAKKQIESMRVRAKLLS